MLELSTKDAKVECQLSVQKLQKYGKLYETNFKKLLSPVTTNLYSIWGEEFNWQFVKFSCCLWV